MSQTKENHAIENAKAHLADIRELAKRLDAPENETDAPWNDRDAAEQTAQETALSVQVRSDWHQPGDAPDGDSGEYELLLTTGGPALRIIGSLEYGEPRSARMEWQDWGTPWTVYPVSGDEEDALLTFARCFYYGEG